MNICVYGASSKVLDKSYTDAGIELGKFMAEHGHSLVFGGGCGGLMGAVADGMYQKGGYIKGVSPRYFDVDGILFEHCDELIMTDTMRERKQIMEDSSDAFITTPGGTGTFEEFFEILTLKQVGRHNKPIAILNTNKYYSPLLDLIDKAIADRFMTAENRNLYKVCSTPEEALSYVENYDFNQAEKSLKEYKNV